MVYVLNRGGRFDAFGRSYDGLKMGHGFGGMFRLFVESVAGQKNSISGTYFSGVPIIGGEYDAAGKPLARSGEYPFQLITYKDPFSGHSRTISNYWGNISLQPVNFIVMNVQDTQRLGLKSGQMVRLVSADNPKGRLELHDGGKRVMDIVGQVQSMEGIRPGTIAVSWHYGHWAYGSNDVVVDNAKIDGDKRRASGICTNHLLAVDPVLGQ